jgi:hypothetical protein
MPNQQQEITEAPACSSRTMVSCSELRRLLDETYRSNRKRTCTVCHVPLPYYWEPSDVSTENWRIGAPWNCRQGCHEVMAAAASELAKRYDVRPPMTA